MGVKQPNQKNSSAVPGYQGYIPNINDNKYGKNFASIAKECLTTNTITQNPYGLSTNGLNYKKHDFVDPTLDACTYKFGASTIQKPHPSLQDNQWGVSTYNSRFQNPKNTNNPTYRESERDEVNMRDSVQQSGFQKNNIVKVDTKQQFYDHVKPVSEYRGRYDLNEQQRKDPNLYITRTLPRKTINY
ncbi:hypothetical protein PPERSA_12433 [Pseudocohnilembus persalinus]|uniref:Uncharacterized protein n=1 Tax=Pseudocohnilembus persalinus TaxID=266149 RepID=A0A0V0QNY4_PSEPJ|nr:hypothetical protein PPERSA_12433 [Pseudocohnilembus persalinus]|eukprot:KRX03986.1 hypothetical protein PPERSA_12433 [Pseudocohnilembus persalinus]